MSYNFSDSDDSDDDFIILTLVSQNLLGNGKSKSFLSSTRLEGSDKNVWIETNEFEMQQTQSLHHSSTKSKACTKKSNPPIVSTSAKSSTVTKPGASMNKLTNSNCTRFQTGSPGASNKKPTNLDISKSLFSLSNISRDKKQKEHEELKSQEPPKILDSKTHKKKKPFFFLSESDSDSSDLEDPRIIKSISNSALSQNSDRSSQFSSLDFTLPLTLSNESSKKIKPKHSSPVKNINKSNKNQSVNIFNTIRKENSLKRKVNEEGAGTEWSSGQNDSGIM